MKNFLLFLTLVLLCFVSCSPKSLTNLKDSCESQTKELITMVDNCSVYQVEARFVTNNKYCARKTFLYTSCKNDSVTYSCGKNCQETNLTIK